MQIRAICLGNWFCHHEHAERLLTHPEVDEWDIYNEAPVREGIPGLHDTDLGIRRWMDLEGGPANVTEKLALEPALRPRWVGKSF